MANEKINVTGAVKIHPDVVAQYAGQEAMECFGIVGLGAMSPQGFARILKPDWYKKGVSVRFVENKIQIDFHIIVAYGVSIQAVAENLREMVAYKLEGFTGMEVQEINVFVEGIRVVD